MLRVHFPRVMFAAGVFLLQACASTQLPAPKPIEAHPASAAEPVVVKVADVAGSVPMTTKIVRFADALGAVALNAKPSDAKYESMLAAFDYCAREQRLAFITSPLTYSPRINYSRVSTFSNRLPEDPNATAFVAPFECLDQKHSARTGLLESEDVPSSHILAAAMKDSKGAVIVHRVAKGSLFRENDLIVSIGGLRVETRAEVSKAVDWTAVGTTEFQVVRGTRVVRVKQTIVDKTETMRANAQQLLSALCKEGHLAPACHNVASAQ